MRISAKADYVMRAAQQIPVNFLETMNEDNHLVAKLATDQEAWSST